MLFMVRVTDSIVYQLLLKTCMHDAGKIRCHQAPAGVRNLSRLPMSAGLQLLIGQLINVLSYSYLIMCIARRGTWLRACAA